jgi:hypothetical protein
MEQVNFYKAIEIPEFTKGLNAKSNAKFPQDGELNQRKVNYVQVYTSGQIAATPSGASPITQTDAQKLTISLFDSTTQKVTNLPLFDLIASANSGRRLYFKELRINLQMCYVRASAAVNPNLGLLLGFGYDKD